MSQEQKNLNEEEAAQEPEPWEEWEGKMVKYSVMIGIGALIILGALINIFILN